MTTHGLTPDQVQMMVDLLPSAQSLRDISAMMGVPQRSLREAARPFIAILRMQGALPPCPCGQPRFHPYGCSAVSAKTRAGGRMPGVATQQMASVAVKRAEVIDAIMTGEPYRDLERRLGMTRKSIRHYLRHLTPEQRDQRRRLEAQRVQPLPRGDGGLFVSPKADKRGPSACRDRHARAAEHRLSHYEAYS